MKFKEAEILYPAIGSTIKFTVNAGKFKSGVIYVIVGFGKGKPNKDGERREFWCILDKHNTREKEKFMWKSEMKRLFDEKKAFNTRIKGY